MANKFDVIRKAIGTVDPAKIQKMYPTESQFNRYLSLKGEAQDLLGRVAPYGLPPESESELLSLTTRLLDLAEDVAPSTELGGRLLVNHMVVWAEAHHLERAIYLAGICQGKDIKEPYRTQINLQPANACMTRYRQVFQIMEWIRMNIQAEPSGMVGDHLTSMLKALLDQFEYFAVEARRQNDRHVHASYKVALANLFRAHESHASGHTKKAESYSNIAIDLINGIGEPSSDSLKVELQYHVMNHREFQHFERLYERHEEIAFRLELLSDKAIKLLEAGGGKEDPCYFWFSSYVGGTVKTASVIGLICASAGALGIDPESARAAINSTWEMAVDSIPGLDSIAYSTESPQKLEVAMHTGGLATTTNLEELRTMVHTGGLV